MSQATEAAERLAAGAYLDASQLAALLGVSRRSIERAAAAGDIPSTYIPGIRARRFSPSDVQTIDADGRILAGSTTRRSA